MAKKVNAMEVLASVPRVMNLEPSSIVFLANMVLFTSELNGYYFI
jgi:hypothetical protein